MTVAAHATNGLIPQIPPRNLDAERAVLGAVILDGSAAVERVAGGHPVDATVTASDSLMSSGCNG